MYLYNENTFCWRLSPAFDFEIYWGDDLCLSINGKWHVDLDDILSVALQAGLDMDWAKETAFDIKHKCTNLLKNLGYL